MYLTQDQIPDDLMEFFEPAECGECFVCALVAVFREVRRVLRDDGTVWLNLGDSYASQGGPEPAQTKWQVEGASDGQNGGRSRTVPTGAKPKDLLGIPWMVAFALRADGWFLRSDIIWAKPNPMPESVTDRPTKAHEYVFLLSKSAKYAYDADAIREPPTGRTDPTWFTGAATSQKGAMRGDVGRTFAKDGTVGANRRSVWTVATQPYAGAHFATFPPKLIEPCILAGAPERACGECGAPWVRIARTEIDDSRPPARQTIIPPKVTQNGDGTNSKGSQTWGHWTRRVTEGFEPSCSHGDGSASGVVLDPFAGAGTTGLVALRHGREFVGIELNPEYAQMARDRIETAVRLGFRPPQKQAEIVGQGSLFE